MANTVTPLADGGRLESWTQDSTTHLQKYDASGAAVGAQLDVQTQGFTPEIVALSNGGFVVSTGYVMRGGNYYASVYDAGANRVAGVDVPGSGIGFHLAASPSGGFLVVSMDQHYLGYGGSGGVDYSWRPLLALYDNAGNVVHAPVGLAGTLPTVSVLADGHYQVQWTDGDIPHTLNIDPLHPPALAQPAPPASLVMLDDQGAHTGPISGNTTDPTPVARIAVTEVGWVEVRREPDSGSAVEHQITGGVQVTAEDVARGYIDVPTDGGDGPTTYFVRFKTVDGVVSDAVSQHMTIYRVPEIWSVTDDVGPQQGALSDGSSTDDTTPTVRVGLESSGLHTGDDLVLRDQGNEVARVTLTADDTARGYVDVTTGALAAGSHLLGVTQTPATLGFHLTVAPASDPPPASGGGTTSGQDIVSPGPGSTITGTAGADTIHASQGPDVITGGAGADVISFHDLPWNSGHVTDFVVGTDRLDLSALFQASGYTGSDPVTDGRMRFDDDGAGGTRVYYDHDQLNGGDWPFLITTLDHVSPTGLTWAQLSAGGSTGGGGSTGTGTGDPPASGGTAGEVITSDQYGDTLVGGAGNDTLNAGQGPDTLTGAGGDDLFAFRDLPWRSGVITDFTPGHDKLDLRPLFTASGYSGADPIGDHRLEFRDDGQGGTAVYFDRDDPNGGDWPFFITTLQGVTPGQIGAGDWLFH